MRVKAMVPAGLAAVLAVCAGHGAAAAASLDGMLPRGRATCYGGPATAGAVFGRVRVTRPERLQSYDTTGARMVRVVVNFAAPRGARLEDTASCRERDGGGVVCASTSCEGAGFALGEEPDGALRLRFETGVPGALWSCQEGALRDLRITAAQAVVPMRRASGSCIAP